MRKYYFGDVYELEGDLFYSHETMIEYARENWQDYCLPIGDERQLVSLQDTDGKLILTYKTREDANAEETHDTYTMEWNTKQMTWLVSELDRMVANV